MGKALFNCIFIIQSLRGDDRKTGRELAADLDLAISNEVGVNFREVVSKTEFIKLLQQLELAALEQNIKPLLHIEAHGSRDGIEFTDGSRVRWEDIKPYFSSLNLATGNNLIIASALCYGMSQLKTINLGEAAPCWALIAPPNTVFPDSIYSGFYNFYTTFYRSKSQKEALIELHKVDGEFGITYSSSFVIESVDAYLKNYCSSRALKERAVDLHHESGESIPIPTIKNALKKFSGPWVLIKAHKFFMTEKCPSNLIRFREEIERICSMNREYFPSFTLGSSKEDLQVAKRTVERLKNLVKPIS